jgi:hypothetical protein
MNVCKKCGKPVPDKLISCPTCAAERNRDAMRRFQYAPLVAIAAGKAALTIHKTRSGNHAQMFAPNGLAAHAYCGAEANAPKNKRYALAYRAPVYVLDVCEKCRAAIEELLAEAREAEAIREA